MIDDTADAAASPPAQRRPAIANSAVDATPAVTLPPVREIVPILSGGGTRVSIHVGVLTALRDLQIAFTHIVGVSGGSIVAALAAAGWSCERMRDLAMQTDFKQFLELSLMSLLRTGGLSNGDRFEGWMDDLLERRTFADTERDLHVLATDINGGGPVLFNRQRTPTVRISQAVRYSMSVPLLFSFKTHEQHIMTDGVVLAEDALHRDWSGRGTPVVCFRLRSLGRVKQVRPNRMLPLATYVMLLVQTFMNAVSREYVHAQHWHNTIVVDTGDVSAVDFSLPPEVRRQLYETGYRTTHELLPIKLARSLSGAGQAAPRVP